MTDINEKLSALFDGELAASEIDELLLNMDDKDVQDKLRDYAQLSALISNEQKEKTKNNIIRLKFNDFLKYNPLLSNGISAAAAVILTIFLINPSNSDRLGFNSEAQSQIQAAINSDEAKNNILRIEEGLLEHMLNVLDQSNVKKNNQYNPNLTNVGFQNRSNRPGHYTNGRENFYIHIADKDLGLKNVRYWKSGKNMVYLYPLPDGKVITLYGNLNIEEANKIISSIQIR
ncbi:hypothetical protein OAQ18_00790 [Gammaproteobacteria bacterium]|nr:hypothetical protein [Gammaproteobacteria bacterium]